MPESFSPQNPDRQTRDTLRALFVDLYGDTQFFTELTSFMFRSDECYIVLARPVSDTHMGVVDLARSNPTSEWEWQNDGWDEVSNEHWSKAYIVPNCDWWRVRGLKVNEEYINV